MYCKLVAVEKNQTRQVYNRKTYCIISYSLPIDVSNEINLTLYLNETKYLSVLVAKAVTTYDNKS